MALNKQELKNDLLGIFESLRTKNEQEDSVKEFAERLASVIHKYISQAEVAAGQKVTTTGSAAAQSGKTITNGQII